MTAFVPVAGGDIIYAANINTLAPRVVNKLNMTTRTSTITFAADPDLVVPVEANGIYVVKFFIKAGALAAADIKTRWDVPAGMVSSNKCVIGPGSTAVDANADNIASRQGVHGFATSIVYNGVRNSAGNQFQILEYALVAVGATAGNITLEWAQAVSDPTGSTINVGSFAEYTQIA